jgi:hypothetical protein
MSTELLDIESVIESIEEFIRVCRADLKLEDGADGAYWEIRGELHGYRRALALLYKAQHQRSSKPVETAEDEDDECTEECAKCGDLVYPVLHEEAPRLCSFVPSRCEECCTCGGHS